MSNSQKRGLDAPVCSEDGVGVLIDISHFKFTKLNSHNPMAVSDAVTGL